jgi:hypothetical protein
MKLFLGSFLAAALCAVAVPGVSVAADAPPILVGVDIAYTGTFAPSGEPQRDATKSKTTAGSRKPRPSLPSS